MLKMFFLVIFVIVGFENISAVCNQCSHEGFACVTETEYQVCYNGTADTSLTFSCPDTTICTSLNTFICSPITIPEIRPDCELGSRCDVCDNMNDRDFTCTSRTSYTLCTNGGLTEVRGCCPFGYICNLYGTAQTPCILENCS
ncbi:uncharacterized protein LOC119679456 [Teleopsis dalmanni]|uniref:uncharacterized protein LOC119665199 n=1 Tax=Teleopsis dalmanni TaxID=139649 RepID=UPI0018CD5656|nr:uncharacterized protein LOC119665199 [Teleopsis dalmanni]XP_037947786.1 uncharacterized protein LOC119679456 [Teleopsis dalmanni]